MDKVWSPNTRCTIAPCLTSSSFRCYYCLFGKGHTCNLNCEKILQGKLHVMVLHYTICMLEPHEEVVTQYLLILVPLTLHTRWPKLGIVCTGKGRPWQIEFPHPAYSLVSEFRVAGATSQRTTVLSETRLSVQWPYEWWSTVTVDYWTSKCYSEATFQWLFCVTLNKNSVQFSFRSTTEQDNANKVSQSLYTWKSMEH